jgi:hypothetical protein
MMGSGSGLSRIVVPDHRPTFAIGNIDWTVSAEPSVHGRVPSDVSHVSAPRRRTMF